MKLLNILLEVSRYSARFKIDLDCAEYLASMKWSEGYIYRKCGQDKTQICKKL